MRFTLVSSQRVDSLQQGVHVQQVILNGGSSDSPAGTGLELTHSNGGLDAGVLHIVSFIQDDPSPRDSKQRGRDTLEETPVKSNNSTGKRLQEDKGKQQTSIEDPIFKFEGPMKQAFSLRNQDWKPQCVQGN